MKTPVRLLVGIALVALSSALQATVFFNDTFNSGSTLNSLTPAAPTPNSTSYQLSSSKSWNPTPSLTANDLKFGIGSTTSGGIEVQALFTTNPVSLSLPGDYIQLRVTFTNTVGLLTANCLLGFGLYNGAQVAPVAGGLNATALNSFSDHVTDGVQNWQGYWGQRGYTGQNSRIVRRLPQTTGADNRNQNLTSTGSGSQSYGSPPGTTVGTQSTAPSGGLVVGNTYTVVLNIALIAEGTLAITNTYYDGPDTSAPILSQFGTVASGADVFTTTFDGLGIGWRAMASTSGGTVMDISSITVEGSATTITTPPDIITQPVPVTVPAGGSCAFSVVAQGFGMKYQWKRYGTNLVDGGNISGATSPMLVISPASAADVASGANGYYVTITGTGGYSTNSVTCSLSLGTASTLVWSGSGTTWDLGTSASWLKGATPATFNYGDAVIFNDTGFANLLVNLQGSYLSASSVTVDASIGIDYVFGGTGSFAGPGQLIYKGAGLLTINNINTYTGGTLISNEYAYLVLNNYGGLGTGPVRLAKAGGYMEVVPAGSATAGFKGDVIVEDDFTIQFDATGAYAGVFLNDLAGTPGKTLTLRPFSTASASRYRVYGSATTCDANLYLDGAGTSEAAYYGTTLAPYQGSGGVQIYNGVISGPGGIIQRAGGLTVLAGQNTYSGGTTPTTGTIGFGADTIGNVTSGPIGTGPLFLNPEAPNTTGSGTVLAYGGPRTIANPLQYSSGTNNLTLIIGGTNDLTFTGPYTLNGNDGATTYVNRTVQVNNTALTTFAGQISGPGCGLIKTGSGTLALTGNNTYDGPTTNSAGTLMVNGTLAGPVTVASGATLAGTGTINGPTTVLAGGAIAPGASIGTLTINNNLALAGNLTVEVNRAGLASDKIVVTGTLANTGTGTVTVTNLGAPLVVGDTFVLFNKAVTGGSALTITGGGVTVWENRLENDGTIRVQSLLPTTPTNLSYSVAGNSLTLSWPANYLGWILQSNAVGIASSGNWFPVPGTAGATQHTLTLDPAKGNVFYRLVLPTP